MIRTVGIIVGTTLAACCAAGTTMALVTDALHKSNSSPAATTSYVDLPQADAAAEPGLNQAVRDGKFEFVVRSISCGHESLANGWLRAQEQGQYCVIELSVANIGTEAQRFADGLQKAYGPEGNLYAADTGAGVVANGNGDAIWNVVNPGNAITAKVVYDLPVSATIATIELHDSGFSRGVKVQLTA